MVAGKKAGKTMPVAVALLLALGIALAGCGGGGDQATTAAGPLTKAQFVKQAGAICQKAEEAKGSVLVGSSLAEVEKRLSEKVVPIYEETISRLRELEPPAKDAASVKAILNQFEGALQELEANPAEALKRSPFFKADEAARRYGLTTCLL